MASSPGCRIWTDSGIDLVDHVSNASEIVIESVGNVTTRDVTGVVGYLDDCAHPWLFLRETR